MNHKTKIDTFNAVMMMALMLSISVIAGTSLHKHRKSTAEEKAFAQQNERVDSINTAHRHNKELLANEYIRAYNNVLKSKHLTDEAKIAASKLLIESFEAAHDSLIAEYERASKKEIATLDSLRALRNKNHTR